MVLIASPRGEEMESEQNISVEDTPVEGEKRLPTPLLAGQSYPRGQHRSTISWAPACPVGVSCLEYHWL